MLDIRNKYGVICYRAKGGYLEAAPEYIWDSGLWVLEPKMDGWRSTFQIGKHGSLLVGRNRQDQAKGVEAAKEFRDLSGANPFLSRAACKHLDMTLLDGELTETFNDDGTISKSTKKRVSIGEFVGYTTWGAMFYMGKDVRRATEKERYDYAKFTINVLKNETDLGGRIQLIERYPAEKSILQSFFDTGLEGGIAKRIDVGLPGDQRTNPFWWKLKGAKTRTVDAVIIGVTEGKAGGSGVRGVKAQYDGTAASFTVGMLVDGKMTEVGKMKYLPDLAEREGLKDFKKYKGRVVEMKVSGWNGEQFRFPRFVKYRPDKRKGDCLFEEQVEAKNGK